MRIDHADFILVNGSLSRAPDAQTYRPTSRAARRRAERVSGQLPASKSHENHHARIAPRRPESVSVVLRANKARPCSFEDQELGEERMWECVSPFTDSGMTEAP